MCLSCLFSKTSIYLLIFLFLLFSNLYQTIFNPPPKTKSATPQLVKVARVIDGDTTELSTGEKVRYISINAPELHDQKEPIECFAKQAFEKNKKLVEGKTVTHSMSIAIFSP